MSADAVLSEGWHPSDDASRQGDAVVDLADITTLYRVRADARRPLRQRSLPLLERTLRREIATRLLSHEVPTLVGELLEAAADDLSPTVAGDDVDAAEALADGDLRVLEAVERCKAVLDAVGLEALARLQADIEAAEAARRASLGQPKPKGWIDPDELTVMEVSTATGLGSQEVHARLDLATARTPGAAELRSRLRQGGVSVYRACTIQAELRSLPAECGPAIVEATLRPKDGAPPSPTLFRQRLTRACVAADREAAERRRAARRRRGAHAQIDREGLGTLTVVNDAEKIVAALERADAVARAARAAGDPRDLDSLRADVITDTLMFGWPGTCDGSPLHPAHPAAGGASCRPVPGASERPPEPVERAEPGEPDEPGEPGEPAEPDEPSGTFDATAMERSTDVSAPAGTSDHGPSPGPRRAEPADVPSEPAAEAPPPWFARLGRRPAARVTVIVPVGSLLGLTPAPGELPGHGWVSADLARRIALTEDAAWRRLLVDDATGVALDLSTRSYRPTATMRAVVEAVDGTCRGPGCTVPAARCDLDHDVPWPLGPTAVGNLTSKHRAHHNLHTHEHWDVRRDGGTVRWRTRAGRTYVTSPRDWLEAVRDAALLAPPGVDHDDSVDRPRVAGPPDSDPPPF
ncbi:hypothetical protein GCM10023258_32070 [Terrabacter aeriphilus]|uniref:DUF222 domain-containing protein n=1 Tax=Terrabacter aeriphilus TaxID=515662 RepID=A0ABP9JI04_9MICO